MSGFGNTSGTPEGAFGGPNSSNDPNGIHQHVSVTGENIGEGAGIFAGINGSENVVFEYKSIQVGDGLELVDSAESILIRFIGPGSDGATTFRGLSDTPNTIVPNALLIGATPTSMVFSPAPSAPGSVLQWNGSSFVWTVPTTGTVTSVGITGTDVTVTGGMVTTSGNFTIGLPNVVSAGTYTAATIVVDAKGRVTSAVSNQQGFIDNAANLGTALGNVFAGKTGTTLNLRTIRGTGAISVTTSGNEVVVASSAVTSVAAIGQGGIQVSGSPITSSGTLTLSLSTTGVASGTYANPTLVIDSRGRVVSAASGTSAIGISKDGANRGNFLRLDLTGDVTVTDGGSGIAIVAIPGAPIRSISNLGSAANAGQIFETVTGTQARLRRIVGAGGIEVSQNATDVVIDASGIEGNAILTAETVGTTGGNLLFNVSDRTLRLRRLRSPQGTLLISTSGNEVNIDLAASGVIPGTYTQVVVDSRGRVTNASATGVVTGFTVQPGAGLSVFNGSINNTGTITIAMAATGVTAGTYSNPSLVVDSLGRITNISSGNTGIVSAVGVIPGPGISVTGASTITSSGTFQIGMAVTGVAPGTYSNPVLVVDAVGRIMSASSGANASVSSVTVAPGTGITVAGGPITTTGTVTVGLAISGVTPGTYTNAIMVVDGTGRITSASSTGGGAGAVTSVNLTAGSGITVSGGPITTSGSIAVGLSPSGVTPGTYNNATFIIDGTGRVVSAIPGGAGGGVGTVTNIGLSVGQGLSVTGSPITTAGTFSLGLASSGVAPGTYSNATITVDTMGRVTSASSGTGVALTPGSFDIASVVVNGQGRISSVSALVPQNMGTGEGQVHITGATPLRFRSIRAGANVAITQNSNEITISATTEGLTATNLGDVEPGTAFVYNAASPSGVLQFRRLVSGTGISVAITSSVEGESTPDTNDIRISLGTSGVSPGTYTNATVVVDAAGRVVAATSGSGGGGGSYNGPENYAFRINFDGAGNIDAVTPFEGVPPGWTAIRDSSTTFMISYTAPSGDHPFPMSPTFYGFRAGIGYTIKFANGNPPTQFSVVAAPDYTGFTVYGVNATALNSEPSGHAWVKLFI
jgi:hypothetical protein